MTQTGYRVLLVDDHPIFLKGLRGELEYAPDIVVVDDAGNAEDAVASVERHRPDVVVMDLRIPLSPGADPVMCGPDAIRRITEVAPESKVLVLSMHEELEHVLAAVKAGAHGYLRKEEKELVQAVRTVAEGKMVLDERVGRALLTMPAAAAGGELPFNLTRSEYKTLLLVVRGLTNAQIADEITLSGKTVANRVVDIQNKLQVRSRQELVDKARQHGIGATPE
ncbi:response regulator transcription factor [Saccharothrix sp. 6-C]|uniref:LuxR family two component transcriptional regulator n=1 Tax=Saccharothrix texasensis TaxID=103734 RepID=A0A3N1HI73_9PSEU|nr:MULTISPECIES: response regulator transcription factor [Saccharothrix]QQQ73897.1 response regulator transcription factor [Saccharothrix sp. 6-C]ROP42218.1 LuxR family two component transcriptional regulator [Saccharothrix texasensis]